MLRSFVTFCELAKIGLIFLPAAATRMTISCANSLAFNFASSRFGTDAGSRPSTLVPCLVDRYR